jgi:hypothetical protein
MVCNSPVCEQYCFLGGCNLECGQNVTLCRQTCYSGQCNFVCKGKYCEQICPQGLCSGLTDTSSVASVRGYLYIILAMVALSMYI